MKQTLFAVFVSLLIITACRKNTVSGDITGSWKLIQVYDKNTLTTNLPPAGSNKDIVIIFLNTTQFTGNTLRNTLTNGTFTLNGNEITFTTFAMTKVAEDLWGEGFLTVLTACQLQSISPCAPSRISIQGNIMKIISPMRYDITLKRL